MGVKSYVIDYWEYNGDIFNTKSALINHNKLIAAKLIINYFSNSVDMGVKSYVVDYGEYNGAISKHQKCTS